MANFFFNLLELLITTESENHLENQNLRRTATKTPLETSHCEGNFEEGYQGEIVNVKGNIFETAIRMTQLQVHSIGGVLCTRFKILEIRLAYIRPHMCF